MRVMRLVVMFDCPIGSKAEKKDYTRFRKFLKQDGYRMMQYSVYVKACLGVPEHDSALARLSDNIPGTGEVTAFTMTEKEFARRHVLSSPVKPDGGPDLGEQMTLSF